jgi:hypothetical protein
VLLQWAGVMHYVMPRRGRGQGASRKAQLKAVDPPAWRWSLRDPLEYARDLGVVLRETGQYRTLRSMEAAACQLRSAGTDPFRAFAGISDWEDDVSSGGSSSGGSKAPAGRGSGAEGSSGAGGCAGWNAGALLDGLCKPFELPGGPIGSGGPGGNGGRGGGGRRQKPAPHPFFAELDTLMRRAAKRGGGAGKAGVKGSASAAATGGASADAAGALPLAAAIDRVLGPRTDGSSAEDALAVFASHAGPTVERLDAFSPQPSVGALIGSAAASSGLHGGVRAVPPPAVPAATPFAPAYAGYGGGTRPYAPSAAAPAARYTGGGGGGGGRGGAHAINSVSSRCYGDEGAPAPAAAAFGAPGPAFVAQLPARAAPPAAAGSNPAYAGPGSAYGAPLTAAVPAGWELSGSGSGAAERAADGHNWRDDGSSGRGGHGRRGGGGGGRGRGGQHTGGHAGAAGPAHGQPRHVHRGDGSSTAGDGSSRHAPASVHNSRRGSDGSGGVSGAASATALHNTGHGHGHGPGSDAGGREGRGRGRGRGGHRGGGHTTAGHHADMAHDAGRSGRRGGGHAASAGGGGRGASGGTGRPHGKAAGDPYRGSVDFEADVAGGGGGGLSARFEAMAAAAAASRSGRGGGGMPAPVHVSVHATTGGSAAPPAPPAERPRRGSGGRLHAKGPAGEEGSGGGAAGARSRDGRHHTDAEADRGFIAAAAAAGAVDASFDVAGAASFLRSVGELHRQGKGPRGDKARRPAAAADGGRAESGSTAAAGTGARPHAAGSSAAALGRDPS